ncbi:PD40 domain-containing protein [Candidatus Bipolaricaulota bacterium]|nr:PD40 domain-containing protein [Candidatus Bipolaricaulota bacterium]
MKLRILLLLALVFLAGCGFPFNQPAVGPGGTIAFFLDETGAYDFLPTVGNLVLLRDGALISLEGVTVAGESGALAWSADGEELLFIETEPGEWGMPDVWNLRLTGVQTDSEAVTLLRSEEPILTPAFTPEGNITYLRLDEEGYGHLVLYDRSEEVSYPLLSDVLSYRPASGSNLTVIQVTNEGSLRLAHVSTYELTTGEMEEIASFFLGMEMEETFLLLPGSFLWDLDPSGQHLALALYDQVLIAPEVEVDGPSLYLLDTVEETGERIAAMGVIPSFSPDGSLLAYIGSENEEDQAAYLYDWQTGKTTRIRGSDSISTLFWIDQETLGLILEVEEGYRLMKVLLGTGELTPLLN